MTEKERLKEVLQRLEMITVLETGVVKLSGGFAIATHDEENDTKKLFRIKLKWGIQNDCENTVHTERYTLARSALARDPFAPNELLREIQED